MFQGEDIFNSLYTAGSDPSIDVRIVQSKPNKHFPNYDIDDLEKVTKVRLLGNIIIVSVILAIK